MAEPPSTDHRQEEMNTKSFENAVAADEKKLRPQPEHAPKCPRCDSDNTKFCYYNNYSLSQPRYFCKSCRRYWTKGGTLRNVPIGGGCRKNKRPSAKRSMDRIDLLLQSQMDNNQSLLLNSFESSGSGESLSMAFARLQKQCDIGGGHLGLGFGFGFDHQGFVQAPIFANPTNNVIEKRTNHGFLSSCSESQPTNRTFNTQISSMYEDNNNGLFENYGQAHTQPLLGYEDQMSCLDLMSTGGSSVKPILREFSWPMGINSHEVGGCLSSLENDYMNFSNSNSSSNNLVLGSSVGNESAAVSSWTNLINTSVLM